MSSCIHRIFWHKEGYRAEICIRKEDSAVQITKSHDERKIYIVIIGSVELFIKQQLIDAEFVEVNPRLEEEIEN